MNIHEFHTKVRAKLEANRNMGFDILELYDAAAAETLSEGLSEEGENLRYSLPKIATSSDLPAGLGKRIGMDTSEP